MKKSAMLLFLMSTMLYAKSDYKVMPSSGTVKKDMAAYKLSLSSGTPKKIDMSKYKIIISSGIK